jgi:hypothetical protein
MIETNLTAQASDMTSYITNTLNWLIEHEECRISTHFTAGTGSRQTYDDIISRHHKEQANLCTASVQPELKKVHSS